MRAITLHNFEKREEKELSEEIKEERRKKMHFNYTETYDLF